MRANRYRKAEEEAADTNAKERERAVFPNAPGRWPVSVSDNGARRFLRASKPLRQTVQRAWREYPETGRVVRKSAGREHRGVYELTNVSAALSGSRSILSQSFPPTCHITKGRNGVPANRLSNIVETNFLFTASPFAIPSPFVLNRHPTAPTETRTPDSRSKCSKSQPSPYPPSGENAQTLLPKISLCLPRGHFAALTGVRCGKSTLLKAIAGIASPPMGGVPWGRPGPRRAGRT